MKSFYKLLLLVLLIFPVLAISENKPGDSGVVALKAALAGQMPGASITRVSETPIEGLYEVIVGSNIVYMDESARYMVQGSLVDLKTRTNFTEEARTVIRLDLIEKLGEDKMLVYKPDKEKHKITVVTDIDCPYCRRLHSEMDQYMEEGVRVRYIFMPLKGQKDLEKTVNVWCSDDRNEALDIAKSGGEVEKKTCDNPIQEHLDLARKMGVRGTPAIILETGEMIPGYVPAKKLVGELKKP